MSNYKPVDSTTLKSNMNYTLLHNLTQSKLQYQSILDSAPDAIITSDQNGIIKSVNKTAIELFGIEKENLVGLDISNLFAEDRRHLVKEKIENFKLENDEVRFGRPLEINGLTAKEKIFPVSITFGHFNFDSDVQFTYIIRDISDQRQYEEMLLNSRDEAMNLSHIKTQFLANMSHEIRTPLNGIVGIVDILIASSSSERDKSLLQVVAQSSDILLSLINDILEISRIEAGKMQLEYRDFSFHEMMKNLFEVVKFQGEKKNLNLKLNISERVPKYIHSDEMRIRQVLINLISNAIKFTHSGSVELKVDLDVESKSIIMKIIDTGVGIPKDKLPLLFTPFTQADVSDTRRYGGSGLGLAISKQIIDALGGTINVSSIEMQGTEFVVLCPFKDATIQHELLIEITPNQNSLICPYSPNEQTILVVEDNLMNQRVIEALLESKGYVCEFAADGQLGVQAAQQKKYDLILMDCQMPIMDGYRSTEMIRKNSLNKETPIIALTANAFKEAIGKSMDSGMNDFLTKPIKAEVLDQKIRQYLLTKKAIPYLKAQ